MNRFEPKCGCTPKKIKNKTRLMEGKGEDTPCAAFALFILAYSGIDAIERTRSPM